MRLGEILIERKLITAEDLERALELQKERGDKIGKTLVDMGFVAMRDVLAALARSSGMCRWSSSTVRPRFRPKPKRSRRDSCASSAAFR